MLLKKYPVKLHISRFFLVLLKKYLVKLYIVRNFFLNLLKKYPVKLHIDGKAQPDIILKKDLT